jgi:GNAT superfamily N-acetyltransferase
MTAPQAPVLVRRTSPDDWEKVRDLRLEMLRDTPIAYAETLEHALGHPEAEWRMRGARGEQPHSVSLVAIAPDGAWVGTMGAYLADSVPLLVGVYVAPDYRGKTAGVTDALLNGVLLWARQHGEELRLEVHEHNARAIAAYEQRGFRRTGHTRPYEFDETALEIEMSISLPREPSEDDLP